MVARIRCRRASAPTIPVAYAREGLVRYALLVTSGRHTAVSDDVMETVGDAPVVRCGEQWTVVRPVRDLIAELRGSRWICITTGWKSPIGQMGSSSVKGSE